MARGNMTESVSRTERRKQATRLNLLAAAEQQIATTLLVFPRGPAEFGPISFRRRATIAGA